MNLVKLHLADNNERFDLGMDLAKMPTQADGGVKLENAKEIADAGAEILVSGSGIFGAADPAKRVWEFKNLFTELM